MRYIFYINVPVGIALMCLILIPLNDHGQLSRRHVGFEGASFFSGAILFLMLGLTLLGESFSRRSIPAVAASLGLSFSFLLTFLRQEKKVLNPIVDVVLLKSKPFLAANLFNIVVGAAFVGVFSFVPFYATSVHRSSTAILPTCIGFTFMSTPVFNECDSQYYCSTEVCKHEDRLGNFRR